MMASSTYWDDLEFNDFSQWPSPLLDSNDKMNSCYKFDAFGFCEYANPDAGLRAIRVLHDREIGDKKLVVRVDAKQKTILDDYKQQRKVALKKKLEENNGVGSPNGDKSPTLDENDDYDDEYMREEDRIANERIQQIIYDYRKDLDRVINKENTGEKPKTGAEVIEQRNQHTKFRLEQLTQGPSDLEEDPDIMAKLNLDTDIEKKDIITREIGKFREIMKKQEEERDNERKRKEEREREERDKKQVTVTLGSDSPMSNGRNRSISPPSPTSTYHSRSRRTRSRERDRDHRSERSDRDRSIRDSKTKEREIREEPTIKKEKHDRDSVREKEEEEEAKDKKKADKKAREKEAAYQERLRQWETRERQKAKEYQKEKDKKRMKEEDRQKEAKRLKEFLEDYDDERDDPKYYKGRDMQKRLDDRCREMESDAKDRQREKEEIEELKAKIFGSEGTKNPDEEFRKVLMARENMYKPKILVDVHTDSSKLREKELQKEKEKEKEEQRLIEEKAKQEALRLEKQQENSNSLSQDAPMFPINNHGDDSPDHHSPMGPATPCSPDNDSQDTRMSPPPSSAMDKNKKKKLDVKEVFNNDEEDGKSNPKKRKLVPLDYGDDKKKKEDKKDDALKSLEEKKKYIKSFIEKIPTDKNVLFNYQIDWSAVDNQLMERKIRPWINKKIIEYIGEPEPTLVDFICSKVLAGSAPQGVLDDVQMVLDEEAEIFVVKMWRLLIYETEAKKLGLGK